MTETGEHCYRTANDVTLGKDAATTPSAYPYLALPANITTQKLAFLGISGSGKTYGAGRTVEIINQYGHQFAVIDTVGNWWGLRLAAGGKKPGIDVAILGGDHGDIELDAGHGKLVAQTLVGTGNSLVIDISDMTGSEQRRFVVDFAVELLALKKKSPAPLMIVWEECQDIVPQKVFGEDAKMVGAVQKLIKKGRNYGIGTMLISQRPAAVNKECLWQCHTMFCFRVIGTHDRKAIEDWMSDHGTERSVIPMSKLETGTCMVWSPDWLKMHALFHIMPKQTYDASATPGDEIDEHGSRVSRLSPIDLEAFKAHMADAIQKAADNDPVLLRKRIGDLERDLAVRDTGAMKPADVELRKKLETEKRVLTNEITRLRNLFIRVSSEIDGIEGSVSGLTATVRSMIATGALADERDVVGNLQKASAIEDKLANQHTKYAPRSTMQESARPSAGRPDMSKMVRVFLTVLAQRKTFLSKAKLLAYADYARSGNTAAAFAEMARNGYVEGSSALSITKEGLRALGTYEPLPEGDAFYQHVLRSMAPMTQQIMRVIHDAYPNEITKSKVLELAKYARSGNTASSFAWLAQRDYITKVGGGAVRASDHLFDHHIRRSS